MSEPNVPAIVGEVEAGRAATVRRQINKLIATSNSSTFDLMDLFHESKTKNYIAGWGFESFSKYAKSLDIKYTKAYYLVKIKENMLAAGLERVQYEPVGMGKLRIISRLKPETEYKGTPVSLLIRELTLKAGQMTQEEVQFEVDTIMGLTEDESMVWINLKVKKLARENVIKPAFEKAKKHLGTTPSPDEEGQHVDASDGRALEMICANFLADPNFDTPGTAVSPEVAVSPTVETPESDETQPYEQVVEEDFNDA
jgi:hypothetical protein